MRCRRTVSAPVGSDLLGLQTDAVLRVLGFLVVCAFTCLGVVLLVGGDGDTRIFGLVLTTLGVAWLVVDRMR